MSFSSDCAITCVSPPHCTDWSVSKCHSCVFSLSTEIMSGDLLEDLMSSEGKFAYRHTDGDNNYSRTVIWCLSLSVSPPVFSPLLRLSPPPSDHDYIYNLDETEGLCDLFDVPILNLWPPKPLSSRDVLTYVFPLTHSEVEKRCRNASMISWAFKDTSALTAQAELSQTRSSMYSFTEKSRQEHNILLTAFPRKQ